MIPRDIEPDRQGDIIQGLQVALLAEAIVFGALFIAIGVNVDAIADATNIITGWLQ